MGMNFPPRHVLLRKFAFNLFPPSSFRFLQVLDEFISDSISGDLQFQWLLAMPSAQASEIQSKLVLSHFSPYPPVSFYRYESSPLKTSVLQGRGHPPDR